ncbi:SRPBCC family protein [Rhabdothermincola salaria]|uniref:SRPBCC family protein n=1 Tax=Rhabdothermincola salaria TaxID=2903142 RepID=UPI001E3B9C6E|nr:SRPBCC family protein [Rhabdothermincola salaria]MCD9623473.1 SRPBCC family protein [Rhabdothermincola salaria]
MELINTFDVSVPVDQAWAVLTDVERIAPCLPGAQLQEVEGDEYRGIVKVKVGPITAQYKGKATFAELDEANHRAVLDATGRDTRGAGNANATITAVLTEADGGTHVEVTTDLTVTGKVAQFGRGVLADVSAKLLTQFVDNLETTVLVDLDDTEGGAGEQAGVAADLAAVEAAADDAAVEAAAGEAAVAESEDAAGIVDQQAAVAAEAAESDAEGATGRPGGVRRVEAPEPEAIDLLEHAGSPMLKRLVPLLGLTIAAVVVWRLLRRRR